MNCLDIITRAMRRIGVVASGKLPTDQEAADALESLKGIYRRWITEGGAGALKDVTPTGPYIAGENERIVSDNLAVTSIDLPSTISDCGVSRPPRDASVVIIADTLSGHVEDFIYDAGTREWVSIEALTLTSVPPLAMRDANGLACYLALELADEFGQTPTEMTTRNAMRWQKGLAFNWSVEDRITPGIYF
jgi:hypothetical protein